MPARPPLSLPVVSERCRPADVPHADEFPRGVGRPPDGVSRRAFLTTMGASFALAGVTGCTDRPDEPIVPYVDPPEQVVAGEPQFFATTLTRGGYGRGVIVTSREGRPIKIEGNPDHPASLGAADAPMQAAVLGLYDTRRSDRVTHGGEPSTWGAFAKTLGERMQSHEADRGAGLSVLTDAVSSPTVAAMLTELRQRYPAMAWRSFDPLDRHATLFGDDAPAELYYDLTSAQIVVSFESDLFVDEPGSLAYARQFMSGRRLGGGEAVMNRLYVAEADVSVTGSVADHRLAATPARVRQLLEALAAQMGVAGRQTPAGLSPGEAEWIAAVASDLSRTRGRSLVVAGPTQPAAVHHLARELNLHLDNVGVTVRPIARVLAGPLAPRGVPSGFAHPLSGLITDIENNAVRTLLILADNPVRCAPGDTDFAGWLTRLSRGDDSFTAHLGLYANETAFSSQWHVPAQHELERWGDARAHDGTASLVQPLIASLTGGRSSIDVLNLMLGRPERSAYETVREHWNTPARADFETWWTHALRRGVIEATAAAAVPLPSRPIAADSPAADAGPTVVFRPDASVLDGSLFHNAWLQELPRPMSKIVWGNAALISPWTAARYRLADGDVVRLQTAGRSLEAPVLIQRGIADATAVLHLGYGRHQLVSPAHDAAAERLACGFDAYPLRPAASPGFVTGVTLTKTGRTEHIVRTHQHHAMSADDRDQGVLQTHVVATPATAYADLKLRNRKLIRTATLEQFTRSPDFARQMDGEATDALYPAWDYTAGPQWGMTIDLTACIGCNACITACQAENNTPVVGPEEVDRQREMHWLRVDSYVDDDARVHHQPVPCMHCENAPCEYVCPVAATTHSVEGLNQMTYNRCVGTRYCSNNCPYKVRRFNFFDYTSPQPTSYRMQRNPDVTVRTRGVMEKCTYCVQRLNYANRKTEIAVANAAAGEDVAALRRASIGRVQTACQQTCPTEAIRFGDLTDPAARVTHDKGGPRNYGLLVELTTKPRTTYLASITNPSPAVGGG